MDITLLFMRNAGFTRCESTEGTRQRVRFMPALPVQFPEEIRHFDDLAEPLRPVINPLTDGRVEHVQAER